ncbi:hypothetical protein UY3_06825 [Chelonia mydas]|uniref:Uncharacterized protein n=1 Tax=Chelonia mydas TaxID=8469 RepID=M7BVA4_CHEMY|nr:hypothetical protein UY3_06825 [Chelonia mydas]
MYGDRASARQHQEDNSIVSSKGKDHPMPLTQNKSPMEMGEILSDKEELELAESDSELKDMPSPDENVGDISISSPLEDAIAFHELVSGMSKMFDVPTLSVEKSSLTVFSIWGQWLVNELHFTV